MFGFIAALLIAFTASWELTFVLMFIFPVLGTVAYLQVRAMRGRSQKNKEQLEGSGHTTVESIDNIRTVAGLGVEDRFFASYVRQLQGPFRWAGPPLEACLSPQGVGGGCGCFCRGQSIGFCPGSLVMSL